MWSPDSRASDAAQPLTVRRYAFALAAVALALALTWLLAPYVGRTPFLFFYGAIAVTAVYGRLGPALLASVVTVVLIDVFFRPSRAIAITWPAGLLSLAVFGLIAATLSGLSESHRAARRRADDEVRRTAEEQGFLLMAARDLTSSLELEAVLDRVAALSVPRFGRSAAVCLTRADGSYHRGAHTCVDSEEAVLLARVERHVCSALAHPESGISHALLGRRPFAVTDSGDAAVPAVRSAPRAVPAAPCSDLYLVAPLTGRDGVIGFIMAGGLPASATDARWRSLVELFAERASLALENARLYTEVRESHHEAMRNVQLEKQLMQARLDALRAQLNPHFLFNALNSVAMLVRRSATAEALAGVLSITTLLRSVLGGRGAAESTLRDELELLEHYLAVERLRYRDRLTVSSHFDDAVLDAIVPSFLLQPLVENAVRHGVARRRGPGRVELRACRTGDTLHIEVRDDGPGFPAGWTPASSTGIGLRNTIERLERVYGLSHCFQASNQPDGGASVQIAMPFHTVVRGEV